MKKSKELITEKEVIHLAELARIELSNREIASTRSQLNEILEYFKIIDKLNTKDVDPTYQVHDLFNVYREDIPVEPDPDPLLKNVPRKKNRYILAPRIH